MKTGFPTSFSEPTQPPLPDAVPPWLRSITQRARDGGIRRQLSDLSRRRPQLDDATRPSAVLMLLAGDPTYEPTPSTPYPEDARLLLTHRAPTLRSHSGQMAFPGGRKDPEDATPIDTAVREAQEETAVRPDTMSPLAVLHPILIPRTGNVVSPVLAYWNNPTHVYPASPAEVADTNNRRQAGVDRARLLDRRPSTLGFYRRVSGWPPPRSGLGETMERFTCVRSCRDACSVGEQ